MFSERSDRPETPKRRRHELDLAPPDDAAAFAPHEGHARIAAEIGIDPERVVLVPSAAAATLGLLYVLADAGDEVLVTAPGDPRARELAAVSGLVATSIPLRIVDARWTLEAETLFETASERTRALLIGSPSVPTGWVVPDELLEVLAELALPIVIDARLRGAERSILAHPIFATEHAPLTIVHGERWLAVAGPPDRAEPLLARLERVAGSFFVGERGVVHAWTASAHADENLALIRRALAGTRCEVPDVEGGERACVRMPHERTSDAWAEALDGHGVTVESGAAYDFHEGAWIVLSLATEPSVLARGLAILRELVDAP